MIKVIIVEDEENIRKSIEYMIDWERCGCVVAGSTWNGVEGLKLIKKVQPDIVITDVSMPFMNGLEMLEEARSTNTFESIIISGYSDFEYAKTAIHLNVFEYILKPIDYGEVEKSLLNIKKKINKKRINETNNQVIHYSSRMKSIIEYIEEHIGERITLKQLCDEFDLSSTSMNNLFKKEVNTTVNDYINRLKINKSIELIKSEKYLIYEIAEMLGFNNYKYFSQVFKKYTKMSPTEFIKNN